MNSKIKLLNCKKLNKSKKMPKQHKHKKKALLWKMQKRTKA